MATETYTLDQAEEEVAALRSDAAAKEEHQEIGSIVIDGQAGALGTGAISGPDTWHSLGALTGFTVNRGRYKLAAADNMVIIDIEVDGTNSHTNSVAFANAMPAAYCPLVARHLPLARTGNIGAALTDQASRVLVGTGGVVTVLTPANDTASFGTVLHVPLD